jgi:hypothetical protein
MQNQRNKKLATRKLFKEIVHLTPLHENLYKAVKRELRFISRMKADAPPTPCEERRGRFWF